MFNEKRKTVNYIMRKWICSAAALVVAVALNCGGAFAQENNGGVKSFNLDSLLKGSEFAKVEVPQDASAAFIDGVKFMNTNELEKARASFLKVLGDSAHAQNNTAALFYLGKIAILSEDITSAQAYFEKVLQKDSTNLWCLSVMGRMYMSMNENLHAEQTYTKLIEYHPNENEAYYQLVNLYARRSEFEKAYSVLDKLDTKNGRSVQSIMTRYNLYRVQQNLNGAFEYLTSLPASDRDPIVNCIIAEMYTERYDDSTAINFYNMALEQEPNFTSALYGVAEIYRRRGDYDNYFKKLMPVITSKEIDAPAKKEYLQMMFRNSSFDAKYKPSIDTLMLSFLNTHPADTSVSYICSGYFMSNNQDTLATEILLKNKRLHPKDPLAAQKYTLMLYWSNRLEDAEASAREAILNWPDSLIFSEILAIVLYKGEKYDETLATYQVLLDKAKREGNNEQMVEIWSVMADIFYKLGREKDCFNTFKRVIKLSPDHIPSLNNYAYFLAESGKELKKARQMSQKTIEAEPDNPTYLDTYAWILYLMAEEMHSLDAKLYLEEAKKHMKHAMLYGGKESDVILDHYACILYALNEYDLAFIYWEQAAKLAPDAGYSQKIKEKRAQAGK